MSSTEARTARLFVAVVPPPGVLDALDAVPMPEQPGVRYTKRSQWHITLRFLGMADPVDAAAALAELRCRRARVTLGPKVELLGKAVAVVPASGLGRLEGAVADAFGHIGRSGPDRPFVGHLTLARLKGPALRADARVAVLGSPISARFVADELVLVASELRPDGAVHTRVARRELG